MLGWQDKSQLIDPVSLKFKGRNYQVKTRARFMQSHVAMIVVLSFNKKKKKKDL